MSDKDSTDTVITSPEALRELIVELNDGFSAYYDENRHLCRASAVVSRFAFSTFIPQTLEDVDFSGVENGPLVLSLPNLVGYHCVLSATGDSAEPWALCVFSDNKSVTQIAHDLPIGIINVDSQWHAVFVNARSADMLKTSIDELHGRGWADYLPVNIIREFRAHVNDKKNCRAVYQTKSEYITPLGRTYVFAIRLAAHFDFRDNFINATVTISDITYEHQAQRQLQHVADHDALTELLNRSAFIRAVEQLDDAKFDNSMFVFVDLDRFKEINDSFGHKVGDRALEVTARRIRANIREHDLAARFGGDEFVICIPGIASEDIVNSIARKLANALNQQVSADGKEIMVHCSLGIAWTPSIHFEEGADRPGKVQAVVDAADQGMYECKKGGLSNGHFKVYDINLSEQRKWLKNQRNELADILSKDALTCYFQPILSLEEEIVGVEALARFSQPLKYFKGIEDIITFAKRSEFDKQMFANALDKALDGFADLLQSSPELRLNLNVDVSQLEVGNFTKRISLLCQERKIPFTSVCVEITELMLERNSLRVEKQIEQLGELGFLISMDDFGTGYSSFKRLMNYNFNELKIDRYFISNMLKTEKFEKTLKAIIGLGKSLDLHILAEGVETEAQFNHCRSLGVQLFQGFYFSPPVDSDTLKNILNRKQLAS